jgi:hypothetical protein
MSRGITTHLLALWGSLWFGLVAAPTQVMPLTLQTDLSDRDLQTLEKLVAIAHQNSASIKEAKAELGIGF